MLKLLLLPVPSVRLNFGVLSLAEGMPHIHLIAFEARVSIWIASESMIIFQQNPFKPAQTQKAHSSQQRSRTTLIKQTIQPSSVAEVLSSYPSTAKISILIEASSGGIALDPGEW